MLQEPYYLIITAGGGYGGLYVPAQYFYLTVRSSTAARKIEGLENTMSIITMPMQEMMT